MPHPPEPALVDWIRECVAQIRDASEFTVSTVHSDEFLLLYGLIARTFRYSDAHLTLVDMGMEGESVPLARAALEHAVTLQWIFVVDGGVTKFRNSIAHDRNDHYGNLASWMDNDELRQAVQKLDSPPEGKRLGSFMSMLRELDHKNFLEMNYHLLSQQVHVTHSAVTSFLMQGDADELHILYEREYPYRYQAIYVCAIACMLARWVLARLTSDETLLGKLDGISDDLLLPMQLADNIALPLKRRKGI